MAEKQEKQEKQETQEEKKENIKEFGQLDLKNNRENNRISPSMPITALRKRTS